MKKNVMMRVASAMLVLTLLTTCVISGTFAKYTTKGEFQDSARVAKWGVAIDIEGQDMFKKTYIKHDTTNTNNAITNTVEATTPVVAPGTNNTEGITITVTGTPEVAFKLTFAMEDIDANTPMTDVFLKEGSYTDYTALVKTASTDETTQVTTNTYAYSGEFSLDSDYYPVKYTLTKNGDTVVDGRKLADVESYLENTAVTEYPVGTREINDTYKLTWAWAFNDAGTNDKADTLLGNIAAGTANVTDSTKYSTSIAYKLTVTATQID